MPRKETGRCPDRVGCDLGRNRTKQKVDADNFICEECKHDLDKLIDSSEKSISPLYLRYVFIMLFVLLIASITYWIYPKIIVWFSDEICDLKQDSDFIKVAGINNSKLLKQDDPLHTWLGKSADIKLTHNSFYISKTEVTVQAFSEYFDTLSKEQKQSIGHRWEQDKTDQQAVNFISFNHAQQYAQWFAKKIGCKHDQVTLPTKTQWLMAVSQFSKPHCALISTKKSSCNQSELAQIKVKNLLGNLSEWLIDDQQQCSINENSINYYNYAISSYAIGKTIFSCKSKSTDNSYLGFRIIIKED